MTPTTAVILGIGATEVTLGEITLPVEITAVDKRTATVSLDMLAFRLRLADLLRAAADTVEEG